MPNAKINYSVLIFNKSIFNQPIKCHSKTYEHIRKISTVQGDDFTRGCLFDYSYFMEKYRLIAIDLSM